MGRHYPWRLQSPFTFGLASEHRSYSVERPAAGRGSRSTWIRRDLARRFVAEGYRIRLYVPYGEAWYPYFMRRLAERPANLLCLVRNMFKG